MKPELPRIRALFFVLLGLAGIAVALLAGELRLFGIVVGLLSFLLAASVLSKAGQLAGALQPFVRRAVRVEVWGMPLPAAGEAGFQVESIRSLGAGLLVFLRPRPRGPQTLLKVAQPGSEKLEGNRAEIRDAAYVSWAGAKIKPAAGETKPALRLEEWRRPVSGDSTG